MPKAAKRNAKEPNTCPLCKHGLDKDTTSIPELPFEICLNAFCTYFNNVFDEPKTDTASTSTTTNSTPSKRGRGKSRGRGRGRGKGGRGGSTAAARNNNKSSNSPVIEVISFDSKASLSPTSTSTTTTTMPQPPSESMNPASSSPTTTATTNNSIVTTSPATINNHAINNDFYTKNTTIAHVSDTLMDNKMIHSINTFPSIPPSTPEDLSTTSTANTDATLTTTNAAHPSAASSTKVTPDYNFTATLNSMMEKQHGFVPFDLLQEGNNNTANILY